jgi:TolB protein
MNCKYLFIIFLPLFISAEEIEIRLKTANVTKPVYVSQTYTAPDVMKASYFEELRAILEFDLNHGGYGHVLPINGTWEEMLHMADVKRHFNLSVWRKEKVPFVICSTGADGQLKVTAFDIEKGTSKVYETLSITGILTEDRKQIHLLSDAIHRDLFSSEGIASCRLIYSRRERKLENGWRSEIYTSSYDGLDDEQLTFENDYCVTPCFAPHTKGQDHPSFFFVSYKTGQSKIYQASMHEKLGELSFDLGGNQLLPSLNTRGSQMAFVTDVAGRPDLFIQNFDLTGRATGKPKQIFSSPRATQASSCFSPDGRRIAFVSDKDGPPRVYMMDIGRTSKLRPQLITKRNRENTSPTWSPDGKYLAYSAKVDGVRQIWLYNFETEEESALTTGPQNKENPSWAPNSLHIVYNTDNEEAGELFLINLNQRNPVQISRGIGQKRFACWESK